MSRPRRSSDPMSVAVDPTVTSGRQLADVVAASGRGQRVIVSVAPEQAVVMLQSLPPSLDLTGVRIELTDLPAVGNAQELRRIVHPHRDSGLSIAAVVSDLDRYAREPKQWEALEALAPDRLHVVGLVRLADDSTLRDKFRHLVSDLPRRSWLGRQPSISLEEGDIPLSAPAVRVFKSDVWAAGLPAELRGVPLESPFVSDRSGI